MAEVCRAVQHAHAKGIIHRDLKPGNVLVAEFDGRPAPKVIDFGIAKAVAGGGARLGDVTLVTQGRYLIGTPAYMPPEQADVGPEGVDTRADVYALGAILYELLTGATPLAEALASVTPASLPSVLHSRDGAAAEHAVRAGERPAPGAVGRAGRGVQGRVSRREREARERRGRGGRRGGGRRRVARPAGARVLPRPDADAAGGGAGAGGQRGRGRHARRRRGTARTTARASERSFPAARRPPTAPPSPPNRLRRGAAAPRGVWARSCAASWIGSS